MEKANPQWIEETIPYSGRFEDSYYSKIDGRAETRHVYLSGNGLPERWQNRDNFTIAELGFGTGLNFLETLNQWQALENTASHLTYISFELYPLQPDEIRKAMSPWPDLESVLDQLLNQWNSDNENLTVSFTGNVNLELYFADANLKLPQLEFQADAWYLDGFAPSRNPELWGEELMAEVFTKTHAGGTFATFSVAGMIRRNLSSAGFELEKAPGFASKLHMLRGSKPVP